MDSLNIDLLSFIFSLVVGIVTATWTISNIKHSQQAQISAIKNELKLNISEIKHQLEMLTTNNDNDHENFQYMDNALKELIGHKSKRLEQSIIDLNMYLEKQGEFKARRSLNLTEE